MGADDNLHASLAHIVLAVAAGRGISHVHNVGENFRYPGMHCNLFIHGIVGFLHFQSGTFNTDFAGVYRVSLLASRYLPLPCLMADAWKSNQALSAVHLISGVLPFVMAVASKDNPSLGHLSLTCNLISLIYVSFDRKQEWGWYTAGCVLFTYFMVGQTSQVKIFYPLGLGLMDYCSYRFSTGQVAVTPGRPAR